ncbi:MAG: efflux RND transporter permease subunit [Patescibacteria group bacterium]
MENQEKKLNFFAKWSKFFIDRYKITIIFLIALIGLGLFATANNQRQDFPEISINYVFVSAVYPGASPETVNADVINPIYNAIKTDDHVVDVRATAMPSAGFLFTELDIFDADGINATISSFKEKIDGLALPNDVITQVMTESASGPTVAYALKSDTLPFDDVVEATPAVKEYLEQSSAEIKEVRIAPDAAFEVRVELDTAKMGQARLDANTVKSVIQGNLTVLPGGSIEDPVDKSDLQINIVKPAESVEDIQNIVLPGGLKLADVADVVRVPSAKEVFTIAGYLNEEGEPEYSDQVVYLMVYKASDGDVLRMKDHLDEAIAQIYDKEIISQELEVNLSFDLSVSVKQQIDSLLKGGLWGLLAIIIVFAFFIDFRVGLVVGLIIPFAFLITLFVLFQIGYSLNILTLFAMILTLGILVDNAIVIAEGVVHRLHKFGESKLKASILAIRDLGPAITAATATTVVVFIPFAQMGGIMGEFMKYIPYTIIIMLFVSYFLAITITPLLSKWILKKETEEERRGRKLKPWQKVTIIPALVLYGQKSIDWIVDGYAKMMTRVHARLWKKITILVITMVLLGGSLSLMASGLIPSSQFPITDTTLIQIGLDTPPGTPYETRKELLSDLVKEGVEVPYFEGSFLWEGSISIVLTDPAMRSSDRDTTANTIVEDLDAAVQYVRDKAPEGTYITVEAQSYGPPGSYYDVVLEIKNDNDEVITEAVDQIDTFVKGVRDNGDYQIKRINNELEENKVPSLEINFDKDKLAQLGITPITTSLIVNSVFSESDIAKVVIREDGVEDDVVLAYNDVSTDSIDDLNGILVPTVTGQIVPLSEIAEVKQVSKAETIEYIDGKRTVTYQVALDVASEERSAVASQLQTEIQEYLTEDRLEGLGLDKDDVAYGGWTADIETDFSNLLIIAGVAIIFVYLILVFQFNSYIQPALIMTAVPVALIGVFPGLWLVGSSIDMISGLGVIALVGIVVNDAIVFVDYYNRQRKKNPDWTIPQTLVYTGQVRFKPIFSTSITTMAGVLPLTITDAFWRGLGTAVVAGLIFSTIGNLIILPILLYIEEKIRLAFCKGFSKFCSRFKKASVQEVNN